MRIALEMNVLTYAEARNRAAMRDRALDLIRPLPQDSIVVPVQALGELYNVLVKKTARAPGLL
jgi:predicted nucleic acid-binding protein